MRTRREKGVALITVMLILILISAMVVGMSWMVMTDQRLGGNNANRELAFYGAEAGMEKLTADVGNEFATQGSVSAANLATITSNPPSLPGITYQNTLGSTYQIECGSPLASPCTPSSVNATILPPSAYSGLQGLITQLTLSVAAQQEVAGSEVKLQRQVQLVAIPVFQFGVYSDSDLAFFNGPSFDFGGRVHTNGNLWLAPNSGPLLINDKVTVVGQVIRTNLENGYPGGTTIAAGGDYSGIVSISTTENTSTTPTSPNYSNSPWLPLGITQSSVTGSSVYGNVSTTANPSWSSIVSAYNGELENGVAPLSLTSTALGGITSPIELIRRPVPGELASNPSEFSQQYFSEVTLRILLDDYKTPGVPSSGCAGSDMMSLDTVTSTTPIDLNGSSMPFTVATSGAGSGSAYTASDGYWVANGDHTITGCIKIEYQDNTGTFHDVTSTILALGIRGRNINPQTKSNLNAVSSATQLLTLPVLNITQIDSSTMGNLYVPGGNSTTGGTAYACSNPDTNAIIRIERVRDNPSDFYPNSKASSSGVNCGNGSIGTDYWPMVLFDTREALQRGVQTNSTDMPQDGSQNPLITASGVMNYIELDAANLAKWFKNNQTALSLSNATGYSVYFSDRRGEQLDSTLSTPARTGSYGYNDIVNGTEDAAHGCPSSTLDPGEDLEGDTTLRTYGGTETAIYGLSPSGLLNSGTNTVLEPDPTFCTSKGNTWPGAVYVSIRNARENPPAFFRRALKIVNGATLNLGTSCYGASPNPPCGLTIASENPVYIEDDYNAPGGSVTAAGAVATSVAADAVTFLSDGWNDVNSFISPYLSDARPGQQTAYRVALIAGKGIPFPQPTGQPEDFGTDGGLHNFLRYLENMSPGSGYGFPGTVSTGGQTIYYTGSLVSFYYNRQAVGVYKGDVNTVYTPPNRVYNFDTTFSNGPQWLPPLTPVLRTINTIGFSQQIMPTQ
ncbi:MAG: pilus assembly PilX N-terminal domain-containing protein [Candidatus Acidiferrales bacterium]